MEEARRLYEVLNKELHEELPALYDSRIPFLVSSLQTLFSAETTFHSEYSKVSAQYSDLIDLLAAEAAKGSYHTNARHITSSPNSTLKIDPTVVVKPYEEIDFKQTNLDLKSNQDLQRISVSPQPNGGLNAHNSAETTGISLRSFLIYSHLNIFFSFTSNLFLSNFLILIIVRIDNAANDTHEPSKKYETNSVSSLF